MCVGYVVIGSHEGANGVAIDANNKIVLAGSALSGNRFAVARFNADGSLDGTFAGGKVTTTFAGSTYAIATDLTIDASGKIVVAGLVTLNGKNHFALTRYLSNGTLDATFSGDGRVTTDFGANVPASGRAVAIDDNGGIVVAGAAFTGGTSQIALARYTPDGTLDNSFSGGKVVTDFGPGVPVDGRAVAIDVDGYIVVAGYAEVNSRYQFALARYLPNGKLDKNFSGDGKLTTGFVAGGGAQAYGVAIDAAGRIVAGGWAAEWGDVPPTVQGFDGGDFSYIESFPEPAQVKAGQI